MSLGELREATKEYDAEMIDPVGLPMPRALKQKHDRMIRGFRRELAAGRPVGNRLSAADQARIDAIAAGARKAGRPVVGQGAERVLISIERGLLSEADAFAKRHGKSRSELIAEGLRRVMKARPAGKRRKIA
jgi:hypothetical protein